LNPDWDYSTRRLESGIERSISNKWLSGNSYSHRRNALLQVVQVNKEKQSAAFRKSPGYTFNTQPQISYTETK
jgi:hypothetical protein